MQGKFGLFRKASIANQQLPVSPPSISIDGRLPDPAIITCNEPLPLRILITKKNDSPATIYLQTLGLILIGFTVIRAQEFRRQEVTSWIITSLSNIRTPLNSAVTGDGANVLEVDTKLWKQNALPNTVSPSFATCNLSRHYELDIKVGLSWGSTNNVNVCPEPCRIQSPTDHLKPELTVQTIRMPVEIFSGIAPPPQLLEQMANRPAAQSGPGYNIRPPASVSRPSPRPPHTFAPRPSDHIEPSPSDPNEAPPSYEDAMADDLAPIDGPRREYEQQPSPVRPGSSGKGTGIDDRLFPDNGS